MSKKPKLAYISPLPPEKTGIAYYSEELVNYLSKYYEIFLITEQKKISQKLKDQFPVLNIEGFKRKFHFFDRIIYNLGNSHYHGYMISLLEEIPGVIILHDLFLGDLINWLDVAGIYPGIMSEESYYSHGWLGLIRKKNNLEDFILNFPLNARVLNNSLGVIIHNNYSLRILRNFYSIIEEDRFIVVPQIRKTENNHLQFRRGEFILASFGFINHIKIPEIVVEGFAKSQLAKNPNSKLIFVGEPVDNYSKKLYDLAKKLGIEKKLKITGFVKENVYKEYLQKSSIAIQLRKNSRGETSRAVLDLLAYGIPVIVNKHGSLGELPNDVVFFVPENPTVDDIANAIDTLYLNSKLRESLSTKARIYIKKFHSPEKVAFKVYEAIEYFYKTNTMIPLIRETINEMRNEELSQAQKKLLARKLAEKYIPTVRNKMLYIDISAISLNDLKTGIQRVVKAQLKGLLNNPPQGFRVEPVRIAPEAGWILKYARTYTKNFLELTKEKVPGDTEIIIRDPGIYFCPDLYYDAVINADKKGIFQKLKTQGIKIVFVIYDMLPIEFPEYFLDNIHQLHSEWAKVVLNISDLIICISEATAEAVRKFMRNSKINNENLKIEVLHLGSDINMVKHKSGLTRKDFELLKQITSKPYFLMVSTLEPRKGHWQVIKAFEILWKKGLDFNLVIVGKKGWKVEKLVNYIRKHPELNKRLFWLGYISDDLLENLYRNAFATIMASEGEGFGLSIIESAYYKTPIIARDIKVFREIAKNGAFYFRNSKSPEILARDIEKWLDLYKKNKHPDPSNINWLSWDEHIEKLKEILLRLV